jgi:hypothetical protein
MITAVFKTNSPHRFAARRTGEPLRICRKETWQIGPFLALRPPAFHAEIKVL